MFDSRDGGRVDKFGWEKEGMKSKGLRVNISKTKVMHCKISSGQLDNSGKWPCRLCRKGGGSKFYIV